MRNRTNGNRRIEIKVITKELRFDSGQGQESFSPPIVQIGSGAHPAFYSVYSKLFSPVVKRQEREADNSPLLVPTLRLSGTITPHLHMPSSRAQRQLYFYFSESDGAALRFCYEKLRSVQATGQVFRLHRREPLN